MAKGRRGAKSGPSDRKLAAAAAGGAVGGARVAAVAARRGAGMMMGGMPGAVAQQRATNAQQLIDRVKIRRQVRANRTAGMRSGLP